MKSFIKSIGSYLLLTVFLYVFSIQTVYAEPQNGFGLFGGLIGSYMSTNYTGDIYREHYSYGFSLEGDAQFVLDNDWSFLPFLMLSIERAQDDENGIISNSGAGFQVRYWKGDKYIGGNIGFYLEIVDYEAGSPSTRYGPGIGLSVGMENINGMIVGLQIDQPMIFSAVETRYTMRLHIGKRWK